VDIVIGKPKAILKALFMGRLSAALTLLKYLAALYQLWSST